MDVFGINLKRFVVLFLSAASGTALAYTSNFQNGTAKTLYLGHQTLFDDCKAANAEATSCTSSRRVERTSAWYGVAPGQQSKWHFPARNCSAVFVNGANEVERMEREENVLFTGEHRQMWVHPYQQTDMLVVYEINSTYELQLRIGRKFVGHWTGLNSSQFINIMHANGLISTKCSFVENSNLHSGISP